MQGLCRLFLFIGFFLFCLRLVRQMDFSHEVKDNIHFLKTLAVYLFRCMDNDFLHKFIDDSGVNSVIPTYLRIIAAKLSKSILFCS